MHQPRPYGRFSQKEIDKQDAAAIELLARSMTNIKGISGLENIKRVINLPSGGQAIATDMGGTFRIIVVGKNDPEKVDMFDGLASTGIPMLFSGVIIRAQVKEDQKAGLRLTEQCRRRLSNYSVKADDMPAKDQYLDRFTIRYPEKFRYLEPDIQGIYTSTQYDRQRPTWYSGAMTEVIQIVGGFGKTDMSEYLEGRAPGEELPEDKYELAKMRPPSSVLRKIENQLGNVRLPAYQGVPPGTGQFQYDYKHTQCHGVTFDSENRPWLIQVDSQGVHAMPLPVVPATTTEAFREWMEDVGDEEMLAVLDRFGAIPSGEAFPTGAAFQAWRRAGVIIKVCDTSDYYQHQPMYAACGWSFNSRGTEGYNTCWQELESGLRVAYGYKMRLNLEPLKDSGKLPQSWHMDDPKDAAALDNYLSSMYRQAHAQGAEGLAVKYKLRRHTGPEILAAAQEQRDYSYWQSLEMQPMAAHSGSVTRVATGNMWWPKIVSGGRIVPSHGAPKFPILSGAGCETLDMVNQEYEGPPVRCDTVVFGCYVDDTLRVIKYFRDEREFTREEVSTFEDIMIVGQWEKTVTTGSSGLAGMFYITDEDDRREIAPTVTHTTLIGKDLGYGQPLFSSAALFMREGSLSRARYYEHRTETDTVNGRSLTNGVLVPCLARDCIFYALQEGSVRKTLSIRTAMKGLPDPVSYRSWTYDSIFHYIGRTGKGEPPPKDGVPVYLDEVHINEYPGSDFASSGDWYGVGGGWKDITPIIGFATDRNNTTHHAGGVVVGGEPPGWKPYSFDSASSDNSSGRLTVTMPRAGHKTAHRKIPNNWYFQFSPVESAGMLVYFQRDATWIAFGESAYGSINEQNEQGRRIAWGKSELANHVSAQHFVGVINE